MPQPAFLRSKLYESSNHENLPEQPKQGFPPGDLKGYGGQWVAFSAVNVPHRRQRREHRQVSERVNAAQEDLLQEVVLERIEIETDDIHLGGAELLSILRFP